ncbi:Magnesium chelatase [Thermodesulfatator indicus DSM 15286]|uniref:Magnesium chelatase n=1 Tax=Thermodesulfatator indicus (strain DSM 15286 / JCM 11887 / CIR29812) TaxID=667014 RepID=F8ACY5_THEID|nr:AAA family ATPase [Thermodesulfatator indicus]AEH45851.1 Magnesium chelatase [Thermodesulfatator indicus DSM 15286]
MESNTGKINYPFSAIVGQEEAKLALMLCAITRDVRGVLLTGEKGTGKSTMARALAALLPPVNERPAPFVNLPLNTTEDALIGHIDLEKTLYKGKPVFTPGLLARAHQGVLYIDEVNLLPEHLTSFLLDAAESGYLVIEREGFSYEMPTEFILIGSMNPEEGSLSPQFLDRFGLAVEVSAEKEPHLRTEIVKRRLLFEKDPIGFCSQFERAEKELKSRLIKARSLYPEVHLPSRLKVLIAELTREALVQGHRADLVLASATKAHAAYHEREEATLEDLEAVAEMVLRHRRRKKPPRASHKPKEKPEEKQEPKEPPKPSQEKSKTQKPDPETLKGQEEKEEPSHDSQNKSQPKTPEEIEPSEGKDQVYEIGDIFKVRSLEIKMRYQFRGKSGRRSSSKGSRGRFIRAIPPKGKVRDVAVSATLKAAAPYQRLRGAGPGRGFIVKPQDLREKLRRAKTGHLLIFCVDASGSMAAEARMRETKGAIMSLLLNAYQKRDQVAMITFRGKEARLVLPPTSSVELAGKFLRDLPVGGSTPLSAALSLLNRLLHQKTSREPDKPISVFLITDGRGNVALGEESPQEEIKRLATTLTHHFPQVSFVVIDTETGQIKLEMAKELASMLNARYFTPEALKADRLAAIAREILPKENTK